MQRIALFSAVALLGCQEAPSMPEPLAINVCTGHQLTPFEVGTGATGYLRELVDPRAENFFEIDYRPDGEVSMSLRKGVTRALTALCERVVHPQFQDSPVVRGNRCVARLPAVHDSPDADRKRTERLLSLRIDIGPYEVVESDRNAPVAAEDTAGDGVQTGLSQQSSLSSCSVLDPDSRAADPSATLKQLTLQRRGDEEVDEIRVFSMPQAELWRWLMAGRVDVAPMLPGNYRPMFEEMETIETIDLPTTGPAALVFNTKHPTWSNRDLRRRLVRALDINAIERGACGHPDCRKLGPLAIAPRTDVPRPDRDVELPRSLRILFMVDDWNIARAAEIIRYQLRRRHGIQVEFDRCPVIGLRHAMNSGDFELIITPMPKWNENRRDKFRYWVNSVTGYPDQRFTEAVERGSLNDVAAFMREDVFVLPLFQFTYFAAIDKRFCTPQPTSATSWSWLADLRLCPGEQ